MTKRCEFMWNRLNKVFFYESQQDRIYFFLLKLNSSLQNTPKTCITVQHCAGRFLTCFERRPYWMSAILWHHRLYDCIEHSWSQFQHTLFLSFKFLWCHQSTRHCWFSLFQSFWRPFWRPFWPLFSRRSPIQIYFFNQHGHIVSKL